MLACSGACAGFGRRAPAAREQVAESPARCFPDSVWFNWGSLRVRFALDDLANLRHYFEIPVAQLVLSNFLPWRGDYRPLGALFYLPTQCRIRRCSWLSCC